MKRNALPYANILMLLALYEWIGWGRADSLLNGFNLAIGQILQVSWFEKPYTLDNKRVF